MLIVDVTWSRRRSKLDMDGPVDFIHDSAVRVPTLSPVVDGILMGHETRDHVACWRPAGTDEWLLIHTVAGEGRVSALGSDFSIAPGETVLYRAGGEQDFGTVGVPWEILWAHFEPQPQWVGLLRWPELSPGLYRLASSEPSLRARVEALLLEANRLFGSGLPHSRRLAQNALEAALLWWDMQNPAARPLDPRILAAIDLLAGRTGATFSIEETAASVHLSVSRFSHLFTQETGLPPRRFAEHQRLERAKRLLELTTLSVQAVASEVGFASQFYFATRFKKVTGQSPSAFRASSLTRRVPFATDQ